MLPAPTPRLRFRAMTAGDLAQIATLELGGSRGPEDWIEWTLSNYEQYGLGLVLGTDLTVQGGPT